MTRPNTARAFTLLEVLLAIGLIGILSGSLFTFLWQVSAQKTAVSQRAMDDQSADAVIERLESALIGAVAADSSGATGIQGSSTSLKLLARGVGLPMKEEDRAWSAGDLQGVEFRLEGNAIKARRWDAHQSRAGGTVPGTEETVSDHVGAMKLRFFDGQAWADSFDSKEMQGLPVAIEVSLWFGVPPVASSASSTSEANATPDSKATSKPLSQSSTGAEVPAASSTRANPPGDKASTVPADRVRIIVVPDGPTTAWKELR